MDYEGSACSLLECMLLNESAEPKDLPLSFLKSITNNFSDDQQIGRGGFATVYKGILQNGTIAVKKLSQAVDIDDKSFRQEVSNLIRVKHKNIVRFLGYCADTQGKVENYQGKVVVADVRQRLLCFEFLPNGGLDGYISDASQGLGWRTRYQIIKGICEGLDYLHQKKMVHLDLKPANVLLNYNMVPKIADFGLSRCFDEKQSRIITSKLVGSLGYLAPEFFSGVIAMKSDIYSLGVVIIEILTGQKGYQAIENVLDSWSNRFEKTQGDKHHLEQIRVCAKIGLECIESNPAKRPTTQRIIETLNEMESRYSFDGTGKATPSATSALPPEVPGNHRCSGQDPFLVAQQAPDAVVDAEAAAGSSQSGAAQQMHGVRPERAKPGSEGSTVQMQDGHDDEMQRRAGGKQQQYENRFIDLTDQRTIAGFLLTPADFPKLDSASATAAAPFKKPRTVVKKVLAESQREGPGATVRKSIGRHELGNLDPFLMLHEFSVSKPAGLSDHPHRGYEIVTYMLEGAFTHQDFAGHKGTIKTGDVQWMTAGRGIVHSEMPAGDGVQKGLQLWINLSSKDKMIEPRYQELESKDISRAEVDGVEARVIAGEALGMASPMYTRTPTMYVDFTMRPGSRLHQPVPEGWNAFVYVVDGLGVFGGKKAPPICAHHCLVLGPGDGLSVWNRSGGTLRFVLVAGKPLGEPVVSRAEIQQAIEDYYYGKNGFVTD